MVAFKWSIMVLKSNEAMRVQFSKVGSLLRLRHPTNGRWWDLQAQPTFGQR
jgi:hypothetical protein